MNIIQSIVKDYYNITLEMLLADDNRLVLELSRNKVEVRKLEDDAEKTTMKFLEYRGQRQAIESKIGRKLKRAEEAKMAEEIDTTDKTLKSCLQSEDILAYWEALASVVDGRAFYNTKHFSSKWSERTIQQPGGGVSKQINFILFSTGSLLQLFLEIVCEAAHFFRLLFTPSALNIDEDATTTWNSFDNPIGTPDWSNVSLQMLDELDKLNEQLFNNEGRTIFMDKDKAARYWHNVELMMAGASEYIINKLRWYKKEAGIRNRLRIPILTPNMLDALAANIGALAKAYEEVSDPTRLDLG